MASTLGGGGWFLGGLWVGGRLVVGGPPVGLPLLNIFLSNLGRNFACMRTTHIFSAPLVPMIEISMGY